MKNKFPQYILFPEIPTSFKITASQTLFIVQSVLNPVCIGRRAQIPNSKYLKLVIENLCVLNFNDSPINFRVSTHIDSECHFVNLCLASLVSVCTQDVSCLDTLSDLITALVACAHPFLSCPSVCTVEVTN